MIWVEAEESGAGVCGFEAGGFHVCWWVAVSVDDEGNSWCGGLDCLFSRDGGGIAEEVLGLKVGSAVSIQRSRGTIWVGCLR